MNEYHKIQTVFDRDPTTKFKTLLMGQYATPDFEYLANNEWEFTEKIDGTNIRIMITDGTVSFGGRTDNAQLPVPLLQHLTNTFQPQATKLNQEFPHGACLYGEGYGGNIQKVGHLYGKDPSFILFDVRIGRYWLNRAAVEDIAHCFGITAVPVIGTGTLKDMVKLVASQPRSLCGDLTMEGVIARPTLELLSRHGSRIITKLKCRDFHEFTS